MKLRKIMVGVALVMLTYPLMASACGRDPSSDVFPELWTFAYQHIPQWSPDGSYIKFGASVVMIDGSQLQSIADPWPDDKYLSDSFVDLSPDGSRIAYTTYRYESRGFWNRGHSLEIATSALDGSDSRRLTKNRDRDSVPVWSPDGSRIAFMSDREEGSQFHVYAMAPDGSRVLSLAPSIPTYSFPPAWSPDGEMLAFLGAEEIEDAVDHFGRWLNHRPVVYTVGSDGLGLSRLGETESRPVWSPDGRRIAFVNVEDDIGRIFTMDPGGANPREVVSFAAPVNPGGISDLTFSDRLTRNWVANLSWSPDGAEMMWGRGPAWVVNTDGTQLRELAALRSADHRAWSPDGTRIAVHSTRLDGDVSSPEIVLFTIARDGSDRRILVRDVSGRLVAENSDWKAVSKDIEACSEGEVVPDPQKNPALVRDCETLLRIQDAVIGREPLPGEGAMLNWGAYLPIQGWTGIRVGGSPPRVEGIELYRDTLKLNTDLYGSIPAALGDLTGLKRLVLSEQQLFGEIPPELGKLVELESLILIGNRLTGSIPPELGNLANLRELLLAENELTGPIPPELSNLKNLKVLAVHRNNLTGCVPASLTNNPNLSVNSGLKPC